MVSTAAHLLGWGLVKCVLRCIKAATQHASLWLLLLLLPPPPPPASAAAPQRRPGLRRRHQPILYSACRWAPCTCERMPQQRNFVERHTPHLQRTYFLLTSNKQLSSPAGHTWNATHPECNERLSSYGEEQLRWLDEQLAEGKPTLVMVRR